MRITLDECIDRCNHSYDEKICIPKNPTTWFHGTVADGYLTQEDNTLWIAFQGTREGIDWRANFKMWKTTVPYNSNKKIRVHAGFYESYVEEKVRGFILSSVTTFLQSNPQGNIIVTGHSLGGALATLCSVDLQYNFGDRIKGELYCITLSSPRVGNGCFIRSFEGRVKNRIRVKVGHDLIPRIPPYIIGFRHMHNTLHLDKRNIFQILWNYIKAPFKMLFNWRGPVYDKYPCGNLSGSDLYMFDDHSLWNYQRGKVLFDN